MLHALPTIAALLIALQAPADDGVLVPADPPARWWKGNLHTHSLWSDGNDYPEMIVDWYRRRGYHFLALSDHNVLGRGPRWIAVAEADRRAGGDGYARYRERWGDSWVETRTVDGELQVRLRPIDEYRALFEEAGRFLVVEGEEITDRFEQRPIHMNASNLAELIPPQGGDTVVAVIQNNLAAAEAQAERLGRSILTHLNHPNFGYGVTAEDLARATREQFFEVYNGHPGVHHNGDADHPGVERIWDLANAVRLGELGAPPLYGLATDDSHNYFGTSGSSPGRGWIMVRSTHLTPERLIAAVEAGDFYASSGVTLRDIRYDDGSGTLDVEVEPAEGATYTIELVGTIAGDPGRVGVVLEAAEGTSARFDVPAEALYVRAVVTSSLPPENPSFDGQHRQAWTQPVGWERRLEGGRAD